MSGWTNVTVETTDETPAVASAEQPTTEEVVREYIEDQFGEDSIISREPLTFQPRDRHWGDNGSSYRTSNEYQVEEFAEGCDFIDRILIIWANDTGDCGSGRLYNVTDSDIELVDEKDGYGGAKGHDVTGYFSDEHSISGTASPWY